MAVPQLQSAAIFKRFDELENKHPLLYMKMDQDSALTALRILSEDAGEERSPTLSSKRFNAQSTLERFVWEKYFPGSSFPRDLVPGTSVGWMADQICLTIEEEDSLFDKEYHAAKEAKFAASHTAYRGVERGYPTIEEEDALFDKEICAKENARAGIARRMATHWDQRGRLRVSKKRWTSLRWVIKMPDATSKDVFSSLNPFPSSRNDV